MLAVLPSDIDEAPLLNEQSHEYVVRLAAEKAQACFARVQIDQATLYPVLAADTAVSVDGRILGKPQDDDDAFQMLSSLAGRWHEVHTGIAVATISGVKTAISSTRVEMPKLSDEKILAYVATGEPRDKAGAYVNVYANAKMGLGHAEYALNDVLQAVADAKSQDFSKALADVVVPAQRQGVLLVAIAVGRIEGVAARLEVVGNGLLAEIGRAHV